MNTRRELLQNTAFAAGAAALLASTASSQQPAPVQDPEPGTAWKLLFPEGFKNERVKTSGAEINVVVGGQGPPVLMMHGAPDSLITWRLVAPELAKKNTLIMMDLRGYGDSSRPPDAGPNDHSTYSKRPMALDGVEVMKHFGHTRFPVIGHDRGGRVARRMALDHQDKVLKLAVLDIVPAHWLYSHVTIDFVRAYQHWFTYLLPGAEDNLLAQNTGRGGGAAKGGGKGPAPGGAKAGGPPPGGAPGGAPGGGKGKGGNPDPLAAIAQRDYQRHRSNPAMLHAMCEDYRASASIDLQNDAKDIAAKKKIECPLTVLWAATGAMGRMYDVLGIWKNEGKKVTGKGLPGGHNLQESAPAETLAELQAFLKA